MIQYLDTSLLVAAYTTERRSPDIQAWLRTQDAALLAISGLVVTEFSAALSIKLRTRQIENEHRMEALAQFAQLAARSVITVPISHEHFIIAARFAEREQLGLKAGDALHLAVAGGEGAMLCTLDQRLAAAGPPLGIRTLLV